MKDIPVLGFAGFSGTGKTTLLEKIIPVLTGRGLRLAVVKHDAHGLKFDHEGKDSKRFSDAGAAYSIVSSGVNAAVFIDRPLDPWEAAMMAPDVDLVLVEGYKGADFSQIGLCRKATGKGFTSELSRFEAVVTDLELSEAEIPVFAFDDYEGIADFIMQNMEDFTHFNEQGRAKMVIIAATIIPVTANFKPLGQVQALRHIRVIPAGKNRTSHMKAFRLMFFFLWPCALLRLFRIFRVSFRLCKVNHAFRTTHCDKISCLT